MVSGKKVVAMDERLWFVMIDGITHGIYPRELAAHTANILREQLPDASIALLRCDAEFHHAPDWFDKSLGDN
jgi:hypothetical protein